MTLFLSAVARVQVDHVSEDVKYRNRVDKCWKYLKKNRSLRRGRKANKPTVCL